MFTTSLIKFRSSKRVIFLCLLSAFCLSFQITAFTQPIGANINNPIVMGNYSGGTFNYTDTKNNSTSNGYLNDYGQPSDDIYYQFTVQGSTQISISHCSSGFDTYMYLLNSSGGLITYDDDNGPLCSGLTASISTTLTAGTYYIISEGYGSNSGNITTAVSLVVQGPPLGATMNNPIVMGNYSGGTFNYTDTKNNSTSNGYLNDYGQPSDDIYYQFTVQGNTQISISHCSSGFDTYMYLLNSSGGLITYDDDNGPLCSGLTASISTTLTAGTYYIISEGYGTNSGNITTNVTLIVQAPPPPIVYDTKNFIRTWDARKRITDANSITNSSPVQDLSMTTQYLDGLGRSIQTVVKGGSLVTATGIQGDIVSANVYDETGVEKYKYLPFVAISNDGLFKLDPLQQQVNFYNNPTGILKDQPENYFYSQANFDGSPLNKVVQSFAPGNSWVGSNVGVSVDYEISVADNVRIWQIEFNPGAIPYSTAVYLAGQLFKNITTDEIGKQVITYTDKSGNTILKKVQESNSPGGWLCTYYVYDDFGRQRFIIPPKAVVYLDTYSWVLSADVVNELCFSNEYDKRGRLIVKKSPGAEPVYLVYDQRDRLVFTQDGNQRFQTVKKWMASVYDNLDRITLTGLIDYASSRDDLQLWADNNFDLPANNNLYTLTQTFYDDYSYSGAKTFSNNFTIDNSLAANEAEAVQKSLQTNGYVTGTKVRLLDGGNTFLTTTSFYDYKGRAIQLQGDNHKGFTDENTTQYDFSGKVRSTYEVTRATDNTGINIFTKNTFDILGRVTAINKSINGSSEKTIAAYSYNELGQLSNKKLAPGFAGEDGPQLESLDYAYNIHGWLLGINKAYSSSDTREGHYFGMELGYDRTGIPNFTNVQTTGNIAGNAWKTRGDNTIRKYDYSYDNVNQLMNADFNQRNTTGAGWTKDKMNFTSNYTYDVNGNILTQNQWGVAPGLTPIQIDQLVYHYNTVAGEWTNRLSNIEEQLSTASNGKLGDFKNGTIGSNSTQYTYDKNANLLKDLNKEIGDVNTDGIQYNFMDLPTLITFKNTNKTIAYIYDAAGNKLRKILDEPAVGNNPARHVETDYNESFVYETIPTNLGGTGVAVLQFFGHEEGRVRKTIDGAFVYDYFIKDHLTNVRMILTEEQKQDIYPAATLETSKLTTEQGYYDINTGQIADKSSASGIPDYQNNNGIANPPPNATFDNANSAKLYKLNSSSQKTGLGIALKVMSGDKIDIFGKSYYMQNNPNPNGNSQLVALDIITSLLAAPTGAAAGKGSAAVISANPDVTVPLNNFLNNHNPSNANKPKAFINYILLDEQFNFVSGGVSAINDNPYTLKDHYPDLQNIPVTKNGYVYVYASNESPVDVFFDNVQVVHTRGRILEENHLYPYGLRIASISSKAAGSLQNKNIYQSDFAENDEETALDEFDLRHYDPQIGRWTTTDPYEQFASPYLGIGNNPINHVDPDGGSIGDWLGGLDAIGKFSLEHFAPAMIGALIGAATTKGDAGDKLRGAAWGFGIGMGVSYLATEVNWSKVGNWFGGLFQQTPTWWFLYEGQKVLLYEGKYGNTTRSTEIDRFKASSGIKTYKDSKGKVLDTDYRNSKYQFTKIKVNEGGEGKVINVGPVPEGDYSVDLSLDPDRDWQLDKHGDSKPGHGIEQIGPNYPEWGTMRARLDIAPGTITKGRDFFYFHNSKKGYSHGCVETQNGLFDRLTEYRNMGNTNIKVKVKYGSSNKSTYGSTDKN